MHENIDVDGLQRLMNGYLVSMRLQQNRYHATGEDPPISEGSLHNEFLLKKSTNPGLLRFVVQKLNQKQYVRRIETLVAAVVAEALNEEPSLKHVALGKGISRLDDRERRYFGRLMAGSLQDSIRRGDMKARDAREQLFTTSFGNSASFASAGSGEPVDPRTREILSNANIKESVARAGLMLAAFPEYLAFWCIVQASILKAISVFPSTGQERIAWLLASPFGVTALANQGISLCADSWWMKLSSRGKEEIMARDFDLGWGATDAEAAGQLWVQLSKANQEWGGYGLSLIHI